MSPAQIALLGAIAGFTIYIGLPLGRLRAPMPQLKALLSAIATGILPKALGMATARADKATDTIKTFYAKAQPIPRAGVPDDIAQCVLWLASDRSTFVNATDIVVDGGVLGGKQFTPHHEGLKQVKAALGI